MAASRNGHNAPHGPPDTRYGAPDHGAAAGIARFDALYEREHATILRFIARRLPAADLSRAEDLTQEAFLTAWRNFSAVPQPETEARAWLYAVARNALLNERRAANRRAALTVRIAGHSQEGVDCHADQVAGSLDVVAAFRALNPTDQEALSLATWEALPPAQAAQVLGISASAYRHRLHRARRALGRALGRVQETDPVPPQNRAQSQVAAQTPSADPTASPITDL